LRIDRVWREAGLAELPDVEADAAYGKDRQRLRSQMAVFKGWTAWKLEEYDAAVAAFHAALDQENRDSELEAWMLRHLLERRSDYLQPPANGAWPKHSLRLHPSGPMVLAEETLPSRSDDSIYNQTTVAALQLLHRLLLAEPFEFRRVAPVYFAYHAIVEPRTGMVLAPITAGSYLMGSPDTEAGRLGDEGPCHHVTLSCDFWLGVYPVTQQEYAAMICDNPSEFGGPKRPVEKVSWDDAVAFCEKLTQAAVTSDLVPDGYAFRLPTEAEWEYCCRAGTKTAAAFGDSLSSEQANFDGNYPYGYANEGPYLEQTSDVGGYAPNAWGLYDMHGNVWEWCLDCAEWAEHVNEVKTGTYLHDAVDPLCKVRGIRVCRGGSWYRDGVSCRSAYRDACTPDGRDSDLGFRVCLACIPTRDAP